MSSNSDMIMRLTNFLKGQAMLIRDANEQMYSPEQRRTEMKTIEEFLKYIQNYEQNQNILKQNIIER